jgi:PAS domain S-box-containing protein
MHTLLQRQLRRYLPTSPELTALLTPLLSAVSAAYEAADEDQHLLVHSLDLSSSELKARYDVVRQRDILFRMSADMLCVLSPALTVTEANPSFSRVLGWPEEEMAGLPLEQLIHNDDKGSFEAGRKALDSRAEIANLQLRCRTKTGRFRVISWSVVKDPRSGHSYAIGRDVTDERDRKAAQSHTEKLEVVGQLAAGIAHEINSPIQFIGDNLSFLANAFNELLGVLVLLQAAVEAPPHDVLQARSLKAATDAAELPYLKEEIPKSVSEAQEGIRRVAELVRALKEFAHPDGPEMSPSDINKAMERSLALARYEIRYVARIKTAFGALPPVDCQLGALSQVFVNLIVNAAHAIEDRQRQNQTTQGPGTVDIITCRDGDNVMISVSDNGIGISDEHKAKLFEPFFTTKEVGRGSGQGLSVVRSIVNRHHGQINIQSEVGQGTTVTIRLPIKQPIQEPT